MWPFKERLDALELLVRYSGALFQPNGRSAALPDNVCLRILAMLPNELILLARHPLQTPRMSSSVGILPYAYNLSGVVSVKVDCTLLDFEHRLFAVKNWCINAKVYFMQCFPITRNSAASCTRLATTFLRNSSIFRATGLIKESDRLE